MNDRIIDILILILSEIRKNDARPAKLELLSKDLLKKGYTESEISSAFSWLLSRLKNDTEEIVQNQGPSLQNSFRILHEIEQSVISPEAYGYIIQLRELELINEMDMEYVLERSLMLGTSKVFISDIKNIVASMLFNPDGYGTNGAYLMFDTQPVIQ
ncbi:MAG TPA: DUF494 family protein [bacterium]